MSETFRPNDPKVREILSKRLSEEDQKALEGAMVFEPRDLDEAIVGAIATPEGHVAFYDYDLLCKFFERNLDDEPEEEYSGYWKERAQEYVDYNLVRALPYIRPRAPRIGLWVNNEDDEEYGDDVEYIRHGGKIYVCL